MFAFVVFFLLEAMLPRSCVHVFSTTFNHLNGHRKFAPSDFNKYHSAGFYVHLDCRNLFYHVWLFCVVGLLFCKLFSNCLATRLWNAARFGCLRRFYATIFLFHVMCFYFTVAVWFRRTASTTTTSPPKKCNVFTMIQHDSTMFSMFNFCIWIVGKSLCVLHFLILDGVSWCNRFLWIANCHRLFIVPISFMRMFYCRTSVLPTLFGLYIIYYCQIIR